MQVCNSLNPYVDRKSEISLARAKAIQIHLTAKETILKEFGEPYLKGLKNGNEILIYVGSQDGQNSSLEIMLNEKGVVSDYTFYEENSRRPKN